MKRHDIRINELQFGQSLGTPFSYHGKHSQQTLAGIDLTFTTGQPHSIDALCKEKLVRVLDPFVQREYQATFVKKTVSFMQGDPNHRYVVEIRELDAPPLFDYLEIEGQPFSVIKNAETELPEEQVGRHVLLRTTENEFRKLQSVLMRPRLRVRRVDVDAEPYVAQCGRASYWSRHEEDGTTTYKQIVRLFPEEYMARPFPVAPLVEHRGLIRIVELMAARFQKLVDALSNAGTIDQGVRESLLTKQEEASPDDEMQELLWELRRVEDAEEELGD